MRAKVAERRNGGTADRSARERTTVSSAEASAGPPVRRSAGASACASCAAPAKRSAGTGAKALRIAWSTLSGTVVRTDRTLGGGSVSRLAAMAWAVAPVNGASPASIS